MTDVTEPEPDRHPKKRDGRARWDWESRYPPEAWVQIRREAMLLGIYLLVFSLGSLASFLCKDDFTATWPCDLRLEHRDLLTYFVGSVGGVIFAIKWLFHAVANGEWHQDRVLWRIFVPLTAGIYALVVSALIQAGLMGGIKSAPTAATLTRDLAIAFLAGHFADGVSGLLTNVANAIFGKVEK